ncbi:hypothetical protein ACQ4PT_041276 [Festuca glaucescens]
MALTSECAKLSDARTQSMTRAILCRAATTTMAPGSASTSAPVATAGRSSRRASSVVGMWRQVQGCDDWDGLLEHPVLRGEVARYGELVNACYKVLGLDRSSRRDLNCKHDEERMLEEVGMAAAGYVVNKYIYAAPDVITVPAFMEEASSTSHGIGYVAVSTDEMSRRLGRRDVLVCFRGTVTFAEWMANFRSSLVPARLDPFDQCPDVKVESGFLGLYTYADKTCLSGGGLSCREQLLGEVSRLVDYHSSEAWAARSRFSSRTTWPSSTSTALSPSPSSPLFGGPPVGNAAFKSRCDELGVKALRVANVHDIITKLPGAFLNEATTRTTVLRRLRSSCYTHVGVELPLEDLSSVGETVTSSPCTTSALTSRFSRSRGPRPERTTAAA